MNGVFCFTYGTLRPSLYPKKFSDIQSTPAVLMGGFNMYNLGRYPAIVPSEPGQIIKGEVILTPDVRAFDAYEGYKEDGSGLYDRKKVMVLDPLNNMLPKEAWVYFMHPDRMKRWAIGAARIESGDWADVMNQVRMMYRDS